MNAGLGSALTGPNSAEALNMGLGEYMSPGDNGFPPGPDDVEMIPIPYGPELPPGGMEGASSSSAAATQAKVPLPATGAEERQMVADKGGSLPEGLKAGNSYCLINRKWHVEWLQWVGDPKVQSPKMGRAPDPMHFLDDNGPPPPPLTRERSWTKDRPGPIDNAGLLDTSDTNKLKREIREHEDYELISEEVWALLHGWYQGGPVIKRRAIQLNAAAASVVVELYGVTLNIYKSSSPNAVQQTINESRTTTATELKARLCKELGLESDKVRLWDYFNRRKYANLEENPNRSLEDCRIFDNNDILLEEKLADGTWPPDERQNYSSGGWSHTYPHDEDVPSQGVPMVRGAVGLQNLGNTCFMNSSLQCLNSVPPLTGYFVQDEFRPSLNETAYKTKGKLAESFASLLKLMWKPDVSQVAPRNFKWQVGQFAEQFAGYGQQDSMEFIEYVLDGLKEDVNLVQGTKPYVEIKEADGRQDAVVAEEARARYQKRNNSRIDDLFMGLFKSTVTCPEEGCDRVSVSFDPFMSVKLSLVSSTEEASTKFDVMVVYRDSPLGRPAAKITPSVKKWGNAGELKDAAAVAAGIDPARCVMTELFQCKIYKWFDWHNLVSDINQGDKLVVYEVPDSGGEEDQCEVVICCRVGYYVQGIPFPMYMARRYEANRLIEAVKAELQRRFGAAAFPGSWRLLRAEAKDMVDRVGSDTEIRADSSVIVEFRQRSFLVVDFDHGAEMPRPLKAFEDLLRELNTVQARMGRGGGRIDLMKCFEMYTETDKLSATDTWYCNKCKEHREAYKKMEFWSLPPVLVLQLKRFTYNTYSRDRLDTPVEFPLEGLDLREFIISTGSVPPVYDLLSVSKHMGGLGGGHYVAYARSGENGKWYYFNDCMVSEATPQQVAEDQVGAYVLFYLRRDLRPESWGSPHAG